MYGFGERSRYACGCCIEMARRIQLCFGIGEGLNDPGTVYDQQKQSYIERCSTSTGQATTSLLGTI
jgi:hypothetical protein